ncbi:MAG: TROVE domain-containing protein [Bifidobacteriaceae bacterium]|jgi:60 kDa SS-A/Ro ribonucleoprotein|nr:TROVE domain-containing protein [Bifidobacteriaceae bacterium]
MGATDPLTRVRSRLTAQRRRARADQTPNSAGGFIFQVDDMTRLSRFLTLGTEGGTYYATENELTKDNADVVLRLAQSDPTAVVDQIVTISQAGRAPKQNPALFALAAVAGLADEPGRAYALSHLSQVARTGTHLALFASYVQQFRGWGRGLRRAVGGWYLDKTPDALAYQVLKYRNRDGWTHRDLLRKAHPVTDNPELKRLFDYVAHRANAPDHATDHATDQTSDQTTANRFEDLPGLVGAFEAARTASADQLVKLIERHPLSWEMLPDAALKEPQVWEALVDKGMPITALMRQLPRLTRLGVLTGERRAAVAKRLADPAVLTKGRVHPISVLVALRTYASGHGARGQGAWEPLAQIVDALDAGFYAAFQAVEPTGKRTLLALDVSGSMTMPISGMPLTAREASAALALVTAATEDRHEVVGFTAGRGERSGWNDSAISRLAISPRQRLDDAIKAVSNLPFRGTDCALPMIWAEREGLEFDTFVVYTDNETWAGTVHPYQALREYRERTGIPAKLAVVAMTSTGFAIADPDDSGMLDVAGFDAAVPNVVSDFARAPVAAAPPREGRAETP